MSKHRKKDLREKEEIDDDPYRNEKDAKDKDALERELKDFPILGEESESFIIDTKRPGLFSRLPSFGSPKRFFSKLRPLKTMEEKILPFKKSEEEAETPSGDDKPETDEKFFMEDVDDTDDDFILDGFEGVYERSSFDISKIRTHAFKIALVLLSVFIVFFLGFLVARIVSSEPSGPCPYECCVDHDDYEDSLCPGLADCVDGQCVKPECPSDFECCPGILYEERPCKDDYHYCDQNHECVRKECPYECCTASDGYREKKCANEGNCVNNKCYLEPCPYECCIDEIDYDDRECPQGKICMDNECTPRYIEIPRRILRYFLALLNLMI